MKPFVDLIERQLALFEDEYGDLIERCDAAARAYDSAPREDAEERYSELLDLVEIGADALAEIRDTYAETLEPEQAEAYEAAFEREVRRRLARFALGL